MLQPHTDDDTYLALLRHHIPNALQDFKADLIIYNAGAVNSVKIC